MFTSYRFEHPNTEESILVAGWSYVWAGLFGGFYVLWKGARLGILRAFLINLVCAVVVFMVISVMAFAGSIPAAYRFIALGLAVPIIVAIQAVSMVSIIKDAYRKRGWMVRVGL